MDILRDRHIPSDNPEKISSVYGAFHRYLAPNGVIEEELADQIAMSSIHRLRTTTLEAHLWRKVEAVGGRRPGPKNEANPWPFASGDWQTAHRESQALQALSKYFSAAQNRHMRSFHRALNVWKIHKDQATGKGPRENEPKTL